MRVTAGLALFVGSLIQVASACAGQSAVDTTSTGGTSAADFPPSAEVEALRTLAFGYWEAFNAYEPEAVLGYLEDDYRSQREEEIRSDIRRLSLFGVQLGVTERTPPVWIGTDKAEMFLNLKEPLGTRTIRMAFIRTGGEWKISFAQEVDD